MSNYFSQAMSNNTTSQLLRIVNEERNDYTPEAIEAAEEELSNRNLSYEQLQEAEEELKQMNQARLERENKPLEVGYKIWSLLMPGLLLFFISAALKGEGYNRKAKELVKWNLYGLITYVSLFILMFLIFYFIFFLPHLH